MTRSTQNSYRWKKKVKLLTNWLLVRCKDLHNMSRTDVIEKIKLSDVRSQRSFQSLMFNLCGTFPLCMHERTVLVILLAPHRCSRRVYPSSLFPSCKMYFLLISCFPLGSHRVPIKSQPTRQVVQQHLLPFFSLLAEHRLSECSQLTFFNPTSL